LFGERRRGMIDQFQPGDVVRVKSGGPSMTIASVDRERIICRWFDGKEPKDDDFDPTVLVKVPPDDGPAVGRWSAWQKK